MSDIVSRHLGNLFREFRRLQLMIYIVIVSLLLLEYIGLGEASGWRYRWHKANNVCMGVIIAHLAWSQLIYYWDNKDALKNNPVSDAILYGPNDAIKAAGMMVFRGIFYYAVIMAYASGL